MSQRSNSAGRMEALGLLDYSSDTNDTPSSTIAGDGQNVARIAGGNDSPPAVESKSNPKERGSKKKQHHRMLAYETLMGLPHDSAKKPRDSRRKRQHPASLRPGSTPAQGTNQHCSVEPRAPRPTSSGWKPQKPAYAKYTSGGIKSGSGSSAPPLSRYDAYQPLLHEAWDGKPRSSTLGLHEVPIHEESDNELRSSPSNATYPLTSRSAEPVSRRGRIVERTEDIHNHTSRSANNRTPGPSVPSRDPSSGISNSSMTTRQRQRVPTSCSSTSSFSSSVPSSSSFAGHGRSPSPGPGRGAWISDAPQQDRPSLAIRARERMHQKLRLRRPRSSFEVRGVVRSPVVDVTGGWRTSHPAATPSEYSSMAESDLAELEGLSLSEAEAEVEVEELVELEGSNEYHYPQERALGTPTQETVRSCTGSIDANRARKQGDELFFDGNSLDVAGQRTLFPSKWSRQERVFLEQEKVDSYFVPPANKPSGQLGISQSQARVEVDETGREALALNYMLSGARAVPGARSTRDSRDDRHKLPSQHSRATPRRPESLPSYAPLCETPDRISVSGEQPFAPRSLREEGMGNWI
ncbi:hypothetical protein GGR53DRAFT_467614 [Hypoxylon sp. FL1150]|nr:hypothetical protein GGR53DRAFT_467614 [Hypoxylon sp. FL1150]